MKLAKPFAFDINLEQAYKTPEGEMHVVGVASDDIEDLTAERMSAKAIRSMVKQANENQLPLLDNHRATFGFGHTHRAMARQVEVKGKPATAFEVDFALDAKYPQSIDLFQEVMSGKGKKQLSIGGFINFDNPDAVRWEEAKGGRMVRVIEDINLEHIATTRPGQAAVPRTKFIAAIIKDIFDDESDLPTAWKSAALADSQTKSTDGRTVTSDGKGVTVTINLNVPTITAPDNGSVVFDVHKTAVPHKGYPIIKSESWSWSSTESNRVLGNPPSWPRYKAAHAWFDSEQGSVPETKGAYKLPHHVYRDGGLKTHERGVLAAMGALLGARGGTNLPPGDRSGVYNHLAAHYRELDRQPPELKDYSTDEFIKHHVGQGVEITAEELKSYPLEPEAAASTEKENTMSADLAKGLSILATLGKAFTPVEKAAESAGTPPVESASAPPPPAAPAADDAAAEVVALEREMEKLPKEKGKLNEKSIDVIRRMQLALVKLLQTEGKEPTETQTPVAAKSIELKDIEAAVEKAIKAATAELKDKADGLKVIASFETAFSGLTEALAKGLLEMAEGFKGLLKSQGDALSIQFTGLEKGTDERLARLEKAAGVRQSMPTQDTAVVTGAAPQQSTEKSSTARSTSRKPDSNNPFRGSFDKAINQFMAQHR